MNTTTEQSTTDETVVISFHVSKEEYERAQKIAERESKSLSELWPQVAGEGLCEHESAGELWECASQSYRARLAAQGKLHQTGEEVLQELRDLRERLADELNP